MARRPSALKLIDRRAHADDDGTADGFDSYEVAIAGASPRRPNAAPATRCFSSGTTGAPRDQRPLRHRDRRQTAVMSMLMLVRAATRPWCSSARAALPRGRCVHVGARVGGTVVLAGKFDPEQFWPRSSATA